MFSHFMEGYKKTDEIVLFCMVTARVGAGMYGGTIAENSSFLKIYLKCFPESGGK